MTFETHPALCDDGKPAAAAGASRWPSRARALAAPFMRLADAWFEAPDGWATAALLVMFVLVWTLFQVVSYASIDLHPDLVEMYAWGRHPSLGYYKHPPLGAIVSALWFSVFPARDWAFQLLAMVNAAVGLCATALIARRYLTGDKRLTVLLLLLLTPFYQFHGARFGANQTLLSTWPIAVYAFLRAFEGRQPVWAAAAGVGAALAMLGKYYSVFLIVGLAAAALVHPGRSAYFRSSSPWISALVGLALLAPHLVWLAATGFLPFHYAVGVHAAGSLATVLAATGAYAVGAIAYVALPVVIYLLAVRPDRATLREALWPSQPDRRMLAVLLWVPLIAPMPVAIAMGVLITSLWTMPAWFLLPILLLAPPAVVLGRPAAIGVAALVAVITLGALLAAPALAWVRHIDGTKEGRSYFRLLAAEATARWQSATGRPLSIVAGDPLLAVAITFYAASHPDSLPSSNLETAPWITPARLAREGWVAVCKTGDDDCLDAALRLAGARPDAVRADVQLVPRFMGVTGPPQTFTLLLVPSLPAPAH
jgi:4-amino-4-deoxy-L-arabinose transferase-like glycosyltransferase